MQALVDAGFTVTVLTRPESKANFPPTVKVHKTDYDSPSSLAEALAGQDAVVSTIATAALGKQANIIDAAVKAGVKRFIPSEFGLNTQKVTGGAKKILGGKIVAQEQLQKAAAANPEFSWTGIATSLFFDWVCIPKLCRSKTDLIPGPQSRLIRLLDPQPRSHYLRLRQRALHRLQPRLHRASHCVSPQAPRHHSQQVH